MKRYALRAAQTAAHPQLKAHPQGDFVLFSEAEDEIDKLLTKLDEAEQRIEELKDELEELEGERYDLAIAAGKEFPV